MGHTIVVVAHNVHPFPRSAEAIVTGALVDALRRRGHDVAVLTGPAGHEPLDGAETLPAERCWTVPPAGGLRSWRHRPARTPAGALARLADRAGTAAGAEPFAVSAWADPAGRRLLAELERLPPDTVVWGRGLPEASLAAVRRARRRRDLPLLCSLGDPLPRAAGAWSSTDAGVARLARRQVRSLGRTADAWTFPSSRVADGVVAAGHLDPTRAFVLPHVLPDAPTPTPGSTPTGEPTHTPTDVPTELPTVVYAGSGYGWLLDGPLLPALQRAMRAGHLHAVLALRDLDDVGRARVTTLVPDATVHHDLGPAQAAALVAGARAVVVPGPNGDLLYTKVVEALRLGKPALTITPVPGTTAELVEQAGGIVLEGPQPTDAALDDGLRRLAGGAAAPLGTAPGPRAVADRLATDVVLAQVEQVLDFTLAHAQARATGGDVPPPPAMPSWP